MPDVLEEVLKLLQEVSQSKETSKMYHIEILRSQDQMNSFGLLLIQAKFRL